MSETGRIAGVELGGTKAIALLWQDGTVVDELRVPTRDPDATLRRSPAAAAALVGRPPVRRAGDRELRAGDAGPRRRGLRLHPHDAEAGVERRGGAAAAPTALRLSDRDRHRRQCGGAGGVPLGARPGRRQPGLPHHRHRRRRRRADRRTAGARPPPSRAGAPAPAPVAGRHLRAAIARSTATASKACSRGPRCTRGSVWTPSTVPASDPRWDVVAHDLAQFLAVLIHSLAPEQDPDRRRRGDGRAVADRTRAARWSWSFSAATTPRSMSAPSRR